MTICWSSSSSIFFFPYHSSVVQCAWCIDGFAIHIGRTIMYFAIMSQYNCLCTNIFHILFIIICTFFSQFLSVRYLCEGLASVCLCECVLSILEYTHQIAGSWFRIKQMPIYPFSLLWWFFFWEKERNGCGAR